METNQSLVNQVRATDLSTLAGANQIIMGGETPDDAYYGKSVEQNEMEAYLRTLAGGIGIGEDTVTDDDDMDALRSAM
jgi:hypothetical protein